MTWQNVPTGEPNVQKSTYVDKRSESQFEPQEGDDYSWTSEHQDEMAEYEKQKMNQIAAAPGQYNSPFLPKNTNPPF